MKIAIVGANGLVGSRLVEQLHLTTEHTVIPIVRAPKSLARVSRFDLEWRLADALDAAALRAALSDCDAVVHTAGGTGRERERMAANVCTAAAVTKVRRVIYLSNAIVHGPTPEPGTNEQSPLHTDHESKDINHRVAAERTFFQNLERKGLEGIALRPGLVYGPRSAWFAGLARELRENRAWWFGDGRGIFNGIYVDNLVAAIFAALAAPATAAGKPYLVGDEETVTWREFYSATAGLVGASSRRISSVLELPSQPSRARSPLRLLAQTPGLKSVVPVMPPGVKRLAKYMFAETPTPFDAWSPLVPPGPEVTADFALRQQCRWRFPHKRAARALGFHPPVAFADGVRRTVAWLAFAEGDLLRSITMTASNGPAGSAADGN